MTTLGTRSILVAAILIVAFTGVAAAQATTGIFVELRHPAPTAVARYQAEQQGQPFDEDLHRSAILLAQDEFLARLQTAGIAYQLTSSTLQTAAGTVDLPHRYTTLINAVRLDVAGWDVGLVRRLPEVKHISVDEPNQLHLNRSVAYIRANGPNSARSMGVRGTGSVNSDGSSTGQVIAVLDTGIDHTNPMFDSTFDDAQFESRSGDNRPVRLQGSPYQDGLNHPKVGYRFLFAQAPIEGDDTGHGTNSATAAGGLKARADSILNNGEIVEGVAPGAVMMDYKVCPSLSCVVAQAILALEDCVAPTDIGGFPKPVCTVVNMSFGSDAGDPNSAHGTAAGNLQFMGVFPEASAGNAGPQENIIGSPSASRLVVSTAASNDPGVSPNSLDVLQQNAGLRNTPGSPPNPDGLPDTGDNFLAFFAPESNGAQGFTQTVAQYYVDIGLGDTPEQVPVEVNGRICLAERGSSATVADQGSGLFGNKAAQCAAKGGIALIVYNNAPGQIGSVLAPSPIPVFTTSGEAGAFLRDTLSFESANPGAVSNFPVRMNLADSSLFLPDTAGFSSRGPNNDFATVKSDITAPGVDVLMGASKIGALGSPTGYTVASGTSFSGPHISGSAALVRDVAARPGFTPSMVRSALMNTATNLRDSSGAPIPDTDDNNFIHETGAGLADLVAAVNVRALMGTNDRNGKGGPDNHTVPDFLPSHSFGERGWINTGKGPTVQQDTITVTMADVAGTGGSYQLSLVDAGAFRGDVTRPIDTPGISITLSAGSVNVPAGGSAIFQVNVAADGNVLALAGTDVTGVAATEFLWFVEGRRSDGSETVRMPFYLRTVEGSTDNAPPEAGNDKAATPQDTPVVIDVLANDSDPDGDALTIVDVTDPPNGSAADNGDGTITYTPDAGFTGEDSFNYTISDGLAEDTAVVIVRVGPVCLPTGEFFDDLEPGAEPGWTVQTAQNTVPASFTWAVRTEPLAESPTNAFTSDAAVTGVKDDRLISPPQVVSGVTQLVFFHQFKFDVGSSGPIDGGVLEVSTDGGASWQDVLDAGGVFVEGGYNGVMRTNGNPGVIPGRQAWTSFSTFIDAMNRVQVDLSGLAGETILVRWRLTLDNTIVIGDAGTRWAVDDIHFTDTGCNGGPLANDDSAVTDEGTPVVIDVLANDFDPDGDPLTVDNVTQPANGSAVNNGDGTVTYTPDPGFNGMDSFAYSISDDQGASDSATVTVTVQGNNPPDADPDCVVTDFETPITIPVLANDSDPDGDPITIVFVGQPSNGTAVDNGDGTITYTPDAGFSGNDSFLYTISDDRGATDTAEVKVTVRDDDSNNDPVAVDDEEETERDMAVTIDLLANDFDPDGDPITLDEVNQPSNGTVIDNGDGTVTYTPDPGFVGVDSFTYLISDNRGGSDTGTVTVTVTPGPMPGEGKVTGGGWIPDGGQKNNFGFNAKSAGAAARGNLNYKLESSGAHVKGDVRQLSVGQFEATFSGNCTIDGSPCEYEVLVEDNAEPGRGADRFSIRVFDLLGNLLHEADDLLGGGNIQIHNQ